MIGFAFAGDDGYGSANPVWRWAPEDVAQGDFFFDPAWTVWKHFNFDAYPGGFDRREDGSYVSNPYLTEVEAVFLGTP